MPDKVTDTTIKPWPATLAANLPNQDPEMVLDHHPEQDPIYLWIPKILPAAEAFVGLQA